MLKYNPSEETQDYYRVLGIARNASLTEIKKVYRDLARIYHPDSRYYKEITDDALTQKHLLMFKLISEAYTVLTNKEARNDYDNTLSPQPTSVEEKDYTTSFDRSTSTTKFAQPESDSVDSTTILDNDMLSRLANETFSTHETCIQDRKLSVVLAYKQRRRKRRLAFLGAGICCGIAVGAILYYSVNSLTLHKVFSAK